MDLKSLKTFHMIVKYGSFIRAAEEMNYVQSTVTMQIQKLESELGIRLIERGERGKKLRLTEAGRLFHEQSLQIVKHIEQLQTNLSELQIGESGHIRIGVTEPSASYRLPRVIERFMAQFSKIRISVDVANTPTLSERVLKGELDLAICSTPDFGSELYFEPLFEENFVVLLPKDHPLAKNSVITHEDIRGHRLLITAATCPYRRKLEMVMQESGNIALETMEISSMTALKHYVESGLGMALVPEIILQPTPPGTTIRPISDSLIHMSFGVLFNPAEYPLKPASSKLYEFIKQEFINQ